jgi:protein-L-isoaspartate(D-aspartate) O-methyltransferase
MSLKAAGFRWKDDIEARGVGRRVLDAMRKVPRHLFVDEAQRRQAYNDHLRPSVKENHFSTVRRRTDDGGAQAAGGTHWSWVGSGYQAAVLAEIVKEVYTEIRQGSMRWRARLQNLGYRNVQVKLGDGYFAGRSMPRLTPSL